VVFAFHKLYNPGWSVREAECRNGSIGCGACKKQLFELMNKAMEEFRVRRKVYESAPDEVDKILASGNDRAAAAAREVMSAVVRMI
jgi:tryptophanyl-tRNA synthetase